MDVGYARVSTRAQSLDLQLDALRAAGCQKIYQDHGVSGAKASRPGLDQALDQLREGDRLSVWRLDRLGRSTRHVLELVDDLDKRGVALRSLNEALDTSGAMGKLLLTILAALSQMERDLIRDRTRAGLEAARARGRNGGRRRKLTPAQEKAIRAAYDSRSMSIPSIAASFGVGEATIWRSLQRSRPTQIEVTP